MTMEERTGSAEGYRFGFQGQETDDEVYGAENAVSFKYRVHDARIGRFLSIDPLEAKYPWNSPYAFSENRVIDSRELEGLERVPATNTSTAIDNTSTAPVFVPGNTNSSQAAGSLDLNIAGFPATPLTPGPTGPEIVWRNPNPTSPIEPVTIPSPGLAGYLGAFVVFMWPQTMGDGTLKNDPLYQPQSDPDPQEDDENRRGGISLGFAPDLFGPGHIIVGIRAEENGLTEWYHNNGTDGTLQQFVKLSPLEMEAYLDAGMLFEPKSIPLNRAQLAKITAEVLQQESQVFPRMYDERTNSCVTPCAQLIREVGYNPPNITSKHPKYLFEWFKTQTDL